MLILLLVDGLEGSFLMPMDALLHHRVHQLIGSQRSIAVHDFNENLSILLMIGAGFSLNTIVIVFDL